MLIPPYTDRKGMLSTKWPRALLRDKGPEYVP